MTNCAKWIWKNTENNFNEYAEFVADFSYNGKNAVIGIACDGVYAAYLNDKLVAFSACADYPDYKFYDEKDITEFCKAQNTLKIIVWHLGQDCFTYINDTAGVIFDVQIDGKPVVWSDKTTLSRIMNEYKNGEIKNITPQLGWSFLYDNTAVCNGYSESVEIDKSYDLHKRPIKALVLGERLPVNVIEKEKSVILDLNKETAGFLDVEFKSPVKQKIVFAYGEHLKDGNVRRIIGPRDFSVEFIAKEGENAYLNPLRRLAGRYIEIFSEAPIEIDYIGIRPVNYPVIVKEKHYNNTLLQQIYDVSVETLKLCMHEHYEDCPWREQSLYNMDSRNQMLFGYYAFENFNKEYVRHNLVLMSKGLRKDGFLDICFPTKISLPIPSFSLAYIIQACEYVEYTKDTSVLDEIGDAVKTIFKTFLNAVEDNGLIADFPYPCWNFYEWAEESDNSWQISRKKEDTFETSYDLILNCLFVYAAGYYERLFGEKISLDKTKGAIHEYFFNGKVYKLSTLTERYSQLGNALALLIGLGDEKLAERILHDKEMIPATISMRTFLYDALLMFGDKYKQYIFDDLKTRYKKMLDAGATSFWETEKGCEDFGGAGSMCHGWSAIPIYYFEKLGIK